MAERSLALVRAMHAAGVPGDGRHRRVRCVRARGPVAPSGAGAAGARRALAARGTSGATVVARAVLGLARTRGRSAGHGRGLVLLGASPLHDIRNTRRITTVVAGWAVLDRAALDAMLAELEARGREPDDEPRQVECVPCDRDADRQRAAAAERRWTRSRAPYGTRRGRCPDRAAGAAESQRAQAPPRPISLPRDPCSSAISTRFAA